MCDMCYLFKHLSVKQTFSNNISHNILPLPKYSPTSKLSSRCPGILQAFLTHGYIYKIYSKNVRRPWSGLLKNGPRASYWRTHNILNTLISN